MTKKKATGKTVEAFEATHGGGKIDELRRRLEIEQAKVEALAGAENLITVPCGNASMRFAVTGDRHHGSLYHNSDALAAFYDHCEQRGVNLVLDVGDILDGHKVYKGQEFELRDLGYDRQLARMQTEAPRSIATRFITGNHDQSFKVQAGASVGTEIENRTSGVYRFLGEEQARVVFETPCGPYTVMLIHPGGGSSYALSYRPQKIVESLEGGSKPDMLCVGHYHKAEFMPSYRNVSVLQAGTFQNQTPFMARQGLAAHVGGWIVDVTVGESCNRVSAEFIAFYK